MILANSSAYTGALPGKSAMVSINCFFVSIMATSGLEGDRRPRPTVTNMEITRSTAVQWGMENKHYVHVGYRLDDQAIPVPAAGQMQIRVTRRSVASPARRLRRVPP